MHLYYVYILTNKANTVFYVGVTSNLQERISQHKSGFSGGFTTRYKCNRLMYYEDFQWVQEAIAREKQLKGGSRQQKIDLILLKNPMWKDLSES
jgi:putative endonuclease